METRARRVFLPGRRIADDRLASGHRNVLIGGDADSGLKRGQVDDLSAPLAIFQKERRSCRGCG